MSLILDAIQSHAVDKPDAPALSGDDRQYTYGEMMREIEQRAAQLTDVSILAITLDNGPEWVLWDLAAIRASIICIPIPPFFSAEQSSHALKLAGASHILLPSGLADTGLSSGGMIPIGTGKITFTSGTTGKPKGVCLSQTGMEQVALSLVKMLGTELADRHLCVLPLGVLLENVAGVYATLLAAGTVYAPSLKTIGFSNPFQPDFSILCGYMAEHKITSSILVPELLRGLISAYPSLPDLKFIAVGGSKISPALISAARMRGLPVYEGYGLSECGSVVSLNTPYSEKHSSAGKILPHIQIAVQEGEIVIKNPAFLGYVDQNCSGPYQTGDLGHVDKQGFVHIEGRKKNVLITSYGRNISPEWLESLLLTQPEVFQTIVYGDAQPFLSALIVPSFAQANIHEVIERVNKSLPDYAQIKNFQVVSPFNTQDGTLTGTGRPRRNKIFQQYQSIITKENTHELLQSVG